MSEVGSTIKALICEKGQAGPEMTHNLKILGNGDMQNGIKRVSKFFLEEGKQIGFKYGEKSGIIKGSVTTIVVGSVIAGGVYVVEKNKKNKVRKEHEEEGKKILSVLNQKNTEKSMVNEVFEI